MALSGGSPAAPDHGQQVVGSAVAGHRQQVVRHASRIAMYFEPEMRQDPTHVYDTITFEPAVPPWQAQFNAQLRTHNDNYIIDALRKLQIDMATLQQQQDQIIQRLNAWDAEYKSWQTWDQDRQNPKRRRTDNREAEAWSNK